MINTDKQMLELIRILKLTGKIKYQQEFCEAIGLLKQNLRNIKLGSQHFTAAHIEAACKAYDVNANWIMGVEREVFRVNKIVNKPNRKQQVQHLQ